MRIAVVTGNPKPASRTHGVALAVADALSGLLRPPGGRVRPAPRWRLTWPDTRPGCSTRRTPSCPG